MDNKFGKTSELNIICSKKKGNTYIKNSFFTAPFKIMKPFLYKKTGIKVMILSASAGIMEGDRQNINIETEENTVVEICSQSYEKIHRMEEGNAERHTKIKVGKNSTLHYNPMATIPFENANFKSETEIFISDNTSKFVMNEILSCGRKARGEKFMYKLYHNKVTVYQNNNIIYYDNSYFSSFTMNLEEIGWFEGFSHLGNMIIFNYNTIFQDKLRAYFTDNNITGGITKLINDNIAIRILGNSAWELENIFEKVYNILK